MSQLALLVATSQRVGATSRRTAKIAELSECLRQLAEDEVVIATLYLSGELPQGRIGIGYAALREASAAAAIDVPQLTIRQVDEALTKFAAIKGTGSAAARIDALSLLFSH